ncbi:PD-(D/E)XK nuclease family protein [Halosolutus halophilus]|uniref:PD-(D/E)XK nuclease family protein n=1 Tax=Halosolutus halophilus TaxID=1552990 RepID=UPI002234F4AC|nr:PD-(D/E)XK nuclease family protein [Halosolutus halophilus]
MASDREPASNPDANADDPIGLDEIETYLRCPRQYQYEHRQAIYTRTTRDAIDRRTGLYRDVVTSALERCDGGDDATLRETAMESLQERLDASTEADSRLATARHRRYDEASIRNAVANYVDEYGRAHAEGALAIDGTYAYSAGGYTFACPVDCCLTDGGTYEVARFVTTLDGIVWENPYSDPVADYRDREGFYPRQVGSVLRAYATIHAVAAAHGIDVHNVRYRYYAIAQETYPDYEDDGQAPRSGPQVVADRRDVTDACWDAGGACDDVLAEAAGRIVDEDWEPAADRWDDVVARSCRRCKYQSMCLDYINEEVQF